MGENSTLPSLKDLFSNGEKSLGVKGILFLEIPTSLDSNSWQKLKVRLFLALNSDGVTPLLHGPINSGLENWQKVLPGHSWKWESDSPVINNSNKRNYQVEDGHIGVFTSGTTGTPKLILHRKDSLVMSAKVSGDTLELDKDTIIATALPFYHMGGLLCGIRSLLYQSELKLMKPFDIERELSKLNSEQNLVFVGVPSQIQKIPSSILDSKCFTFYAGGDQVTKEHWLRFNENKATLISTYGQSESCGAILYDKHQGKVQPYSDVEYQINSDGLFTYKTPRLASQILLLNDENIEKQKISSNEFFITSDLAKFEDKNIQFLGRKDQLFQCGGEMISPTQTKVRIQSHLKGLGFDSLQIKILGMPDESLGHVPVAFIEGLSKMELNELSNKLSSLESGPQKLRYLAPYPESVGIKPSKEEFLASYQHFSVALKSSKS